MKIPNHVAIIPDGNRRWAKKRHLPALEGHRIAAEKTMPELIEEAVRLKIKFLTFWALSTENLQKRNKGEVAHLFNLIHYLLKRKINEFKKNKISIRVIGDLAGLPEAIRKDINKAVTETSNNNSLTIILAINYGGRDEIMRAVKKIQRPGWENLNLKQKDFSDQLDTSGIPDPDLIIRTGGEIRLSGFMLWQSEYSEMYFSDLYFPDFKKEELKKAVEEYQDRQRRFGR